MKIDAQRGWFRGLGDACCFAWIGEGMSRAGHDVEFFCTGWRSDLLKMFYMKTTADPYGAVVPQIGYETARKIGSHLNYLEWIMDQLGITVAPHRPRHDLTPMDRDNGRKASAEVLIWPECVTRPRTWPKAYFIELGLLLRREGIECRMVTEKRDYDLTVFHEIYGASWSFLAGACQAAKLVIGNDSGPAHFSGTLGTPTLAIMGMTTEKIYGYLPEVVPIRKKSLPCAGCHGLQPYRRSCDTGCLELYRTYPEEVAAIAIEKLRGEKRSPIELRDNRGVVLELRYETETPRIHREAVAA
jgi:hypothetical protein